MACVQVPIQVHSPILLSLHHIFQPETIINNLSIPPLHQILISETGKHKADIRIHIIINKTEKYKTTPNTLNIVGVNKNYHQIPNYRKTISLLVQKRKPKASYDEIFSDLPTRQITVDTLSEEQKLCGICGSAMVPIGHEIIRTELVYTEPKLERIEYIATTYSCPECKDTEEPHFHVCRLHTHNLCYTVSA